LKQVDLLLKEVPGIVISSIRRQQDRIIVRAYEPMGEKADIVLEFSFPVKKVLRYSGNSLNPEEICTEKNRHKDVFEPYEIVRYEIETHKMYSNN